MMQFDDTFCQSQANTCPGDRFSKRLYILCLVKSVKNPFQVFRFDAYAGILYFYNCRLVPTIDF